MKYVALEEVYSSWNQRQNLISRKDFTYFYERHVLHSLAMGQILSLSKNVRVVDLGAGGGFPSVPLAILFPQVHFTLVDASQKKVCAAESMTHSLRLENISCVHTRIENMSGEFDWAIGRAVAPLPRLLGWLLRIERRQKHPLAPYLCYWTGDHVRSTHYLYQTFLLSRIYQEPWFAGKQLLLLHLT